MRQIAGGNARDECQLGLFAAKWAMLRPCSASIWRSEPLPVSLLSAGQALFIAESVFDAMSYRDRSRSPRRDSRYDSYGGGYGGGSR